MDKFNLKNISEVKKSFIEKHENHILFMFLFIVSTSSFLFYFLHNKITSFADTESRLDLARKITDNLHPGFAQFGNIWLPLPEMFMQLFIWNNYLWHSGIAGSLMSMPTFILGGFFIFKTAKLLHNSFLTSFLATCIYALNLNMFYLQTTAMSESLFMCCTAGAIYYFVKWIKTNNGFNLIPAAIAVSAMTYTRYEGLSVLFASIPMVFIIAWILKKKFSIAEGETILYAALAITGLAAWSIYLLAIFGDPLYWLHFYTASTVVTTSTGHTVHIYSQHKPFLAAVYQYFTSFVWMIGIIPTIFCAIGLVILFIKTIRSRSLYFLPLLLPLAIYLFMVLSLQKDTPILQPDLSFQNILSGNTSNLINFNIRYGVLLLPWVAIISSYLFSFRFKIINLVLFSFFFIQIFTYVYPKYTVLYQLTFLEHTTKFYPYLVGWMKANYTGGEILMSSSSHEDQMFQMGYNYRTFIHEGAGKYWKESIDNPSRYATYVVIDRGHPDDTLAKYFVDNNHRQGILDRDYNLVFDDIKENVKIYKIKTHPYFQI